MRVVRGVGLLSVLVCVLALPVAGSSAGSASPNPFARLNQPKLDSQLGRVAETSAQQGARTALTRAASEGLSTEQSKVRVVVVAKPGAASAASQR